MKKVVIEFENEEEYKKDYDRLKDTYLSCWEDSAWDADLDIILELMEKIFPQIYKKDEDWD